MCGFRFIAIVGDCGLGWSIRTHSSSLPLLLNLVIDVSNVESSNELARLFRILVLGLYEHCLVTVFYLKMGRALRPLSILIL